MNNKLNLKEILDLHAKWLNRYPGGQRANLSHANLSGANLSGAYLIGADLIDADLIDADLIDADLSGADLSHANLIDANLSHANLIDANLSGADLSGADLSGANLSHADLSHANLSGAIGADLALAMASHLPEGAFVGWKKCRGGVIVKLLIPETAKRSHGASRKCRAEYVKVLEVYGPDGISKKGLVGVSGYDRGIEYRKGKMVYPDGFDDDRWNICGRGIHFFLTRLEAEAYSL